MPLLKKEEVEGIVMKYINENHPKLSDGAKLSDITYFDASHRWKVSFGDGDDAFFVTIYDGTTHNCKLSKFCGEPRPTWVDCIWAAALICGGIFILSFRSSIELFLIWSVASLLLAFLSPSILIDELVMGGGDIRKVKVPRKRIFTVCITAVICFVAYLIKLH